MISRAALIVLVILGAALFAVCWLIGMIVEEIRGDEP